MWSLGCMLYTMVVGRPPFDVSLSSAIIYTVTHCCNLIGLPVFLSRTDQTVRALCATQADDVKNVLARITKAVFKMPR